jgi:hypothetical protein
MRYTEVVVGLTELLAKHADYDAEDPRAWDPKVIIEDLSNRQTEEYDLLFRDGKLIIQLI